MLLVHITVSLTVRLTILPDLQPPLSVRYPTIEIGADCVLPYSHIARFNLMR